MTISAVSLALTETYFNAGASGALAAFHSWMISPAMTGRADAMTTAKAAAAVVVRVDVNIGTLGI